MTTLVYFAPVAWNSYAQRPHHLVHAFLHRGAHVVWVDPYPTRFPALRDLRGRRRDAVAVPRPAALTVVTPRALPIEPFAAGQRVNHALFGRTLLRSLARGRQGRLVVGVARPSSLASRALEALDPAWSFFDALDDFPQFYRGLARTAVARIEAGIAGMADAVLVPSTALWDKLSAAGSRRLRVPNACDPRSLPRGPLAPAAPPVVGYVGCIGAWFDWPLVIQLARAHPDLRFELTGPCYVRPARLPSNVVLRGVCGHPDAMERMARFSVGLIPFVRNTLTASVDPIKYYEYRALGVPVLSTRFGEMAQHGADTGVFFADEPDALRRALEAPRPSEPALQAFRDANSWERRFEEAGLFEAISGRIRLDRV